MELATILVLIGVILAVVAAFVHDHFHRLLAAAVILVGVGVLVGAGGIAVR